jgi:hypothetical protein
MQGMNQANSSTLDRVPNGNGETNYIVGVDDIRVFQVKNSTHPGCSFPVPHFMKMPRKTQQPVGFWTLSKRPIHIVQRKMVDSDAVPFFHPF